MDYSTRMDSPQPQDLSASRPDYSTDGSEDIDSDSTNNSCPKRAKMEDNNNIEGYDLSSKRQFLASLELERSPEAEEEQDCFVEEFRRMKAKGEFSCRLCSSVFPNLRALKSHNRVHMEGPTFECNLCPYSSIDRGAVTHHMRTHNGDRPFECSICKFAFTTKANCERHLRNRHSSSTKEAATQMELPIDLSVKKPQRTAPDPPPPPPYLSFPRFFVPPPSLLYSNLQKELIRGLSLSGGRLLESPVPNSKKEEVKMVVKNGILVPKQKQRRYRTERPFGCEHCQARFTLRSNMERHIKQQHPEFWSQRQRGGGGGRKREKPLNNNSTSNNYNSGAPDLKEISEDVKTALMEQLKGKEESQRREMMATDLASVSRLLDVAKSQNFNEYFDRQEDEEDEEEDEEGLVASNSEASSEERSSPETESTTGKKRSAYSLAPNRVSCPYCAREFPWTSSLRRHILTHTGQKPYKCPECPLLFTTKSNCDRHAVRKHGGVRRTDRPVVVEDDPLPELSETRRRRSEDIPSVPHPTTGSEMPFKCHLCDGSFVERHDTLDHLKSAHPNEYESLVAKGALDSSSEPDDVVEAENKDHANRKVVCAFCLRRFWSAEDLRRHMRTHTGERPFSCELCSRRFTLKHSMLRHRKKHNGPAPFPPIKSSPALPRPAAADLTTKGDLISNLLGIQDSSLVETMLESTPTAAAKILGIDQK